MSMKVARPKAPALKQKRLSPDDRRSEFVAKATEFFSEEGFDGGTRDPVRLSRGRHAWSANAAMKAVERAAYV